MNEPTEQTDTQTTTKAKADFDTFEARSVGHRLYYEQATKGEGNECIQRCVNEINRLRMEVIPAIAARAETAETERDEARAGVADNQEWDNTDYAHPAFWRGQKDGMNKNGFEAALVNDCAELLERAETAESELETAHAIHCDFSERVRELGRENATLRAENDLLQQANSKLITFAITGTIAALPSDDPRWKDSEGKQYIYTQTADTVVLNEPAGGGRMLRTVCKIVGYATVDTNGIIAENDLMRKAE